MLPDGTDERAGIWDRVKARKIEPFFNRKKFV
jgi:hypothetical protein